MNCLKKPIIKLEILGIDGVGKSTHIDEVLKKYNGQKIKKIHVYPYKLNVLKFIEDTHIMSFYSEEFDPNDTEIHQI